MKRFVLSAMPGPQGVVRLYEKDYHYLVRVRRLRAGELFDAILPGGAERQIRVLSTVDNILIGQCLDVPSAELPPAKLPLAEKASIIPPIELFQALPKGTKMDLIVRQAAEGGVSAVVPFESEYSTAHLNADSGRIQRWERIIREARQQSGSVTETVVRPVCGLDGLLDYWASRQKEYPLSVGIVLHQEPLVKGSFHDYLCINPGFVALAVGPEGGFSPKEVSLFLAAGFRPICMGNTVLRTETAALYGTAALRIILLENESWTPKG